MAYCGPPTGIMRCRLTKGVRRNTNGSIRGCDCVYVHAWDCATGNPVQFWMTARDAKKLGSNKFSFKVTNPADPLYTSPFGDCYCLFFALNLTASYENQTGSIVRQVNGLHTLDEVIPQEGVGGFLYDPSPDPCGSIRAPVDGDPDAITCGACAADCIHRVPCSSYTVAFHLKAEFWEPLFGGGPDGEDIPNPHSCIGDGTDPPDSTGESDFSFVTGFDLTKDPNQICVVFSADDDRQSLTLSPTTHIIEDDKIVAYAVQVAAGCGSEFVAMNIDFGDTGFTAFTGDTGSTRSRATEISGTYPDSITCIQITSGGAVVRLTLTSVLVTCLDVGGPKMIDDGGI